MILSAVESQNDESLELENYSSSLAFAGPSVLLASCSKAV